MSEMPPSFRVLLIEDDPADRHLIDKALRDSNLPVSCVMYAKNGYDALDLLERLKQHDSLPDLVFLDLHMPDYNGHETLREFKQRGVLSSSFVMVLSSSRREEDAKRVYETGGHAYLVKPDSYPCFVDLMESVGNYVLKTFQPSAISRAS